MRKAMYYFMFSLLLLQLEAYGAVSYGTADGYITDVDSERFLRYYEINSFPKPIKKDNYYKLIFKSELTNEFREQYKQKFGYSGTEQVYNQRNHFSEIEYLPGVRVSLEEDSIRQREFGEYMVKRLVEYHVDQYAKNKPELKAIYEVKEKLSNVKVEVKKGYQLKVHYSLSGNYVDFKMTNPYDVKMVYTLEMDTSKFGPSDVKERLMSMGYAFTKTVSMSAQYKIIDGVFKLVTTKKLKKNMSTTLTGSTNTHDHGTSDREDLVLLGFSWVH